MKAKLRILHLEDNEPDAILIHSMLDEQGIACDINRVQDREHFAAALEQGGFDMIFSDFTLPGFNGIAALGLARQKCPAVPFLFVSGTLGEEIAVETLKSGATDYILKQRLARLAPAVRRAIEEKRTEEAMIRSESKYRLLFESLGEATFLMEAAAGRVLDANKAAEELLGRTRGEIIGLNQSEFHSPATLTEFHRRFTDPARPSERIRFEGEILTRDRGPVPVAITATPITFYDNGLILGSYRDISEFKRAEEKNEILNAQLGHDLRTRTGELDVANRELEIHSQVITHDLVVRMRTLDDSAKRLIMQHAPWCDAATSAALTALHNGAQQAQQVMERMLEFTELSLRPLKRTLLDMTALAQAAFQELKQACPEREFRFELSPLPPAPGDPAGIREVFRQLLANAIRFTRGRQPAEISVGAYTDETHNSYYVSDNGIGFMSEDADRLFDAFQRLHREQDSDGLGLGLALVQRVIQRHGGQVGAEGRLNAGAVFCFTLPKQMAAAA